MLKREFCEEEEGWKSFNLQNISHAGLGEEQNENDSLEIAAETERTEQRRLSFYWTRTYCKTICGPNSNEDEHIVKLFSRSQINAFVCWLHVFLFHLINIRWNCLLYFPFDIKKITNNLDQVRKSNHSLLNSKLTSMQTDWKKRKQPCRLLLSSPFYGGAIDFRF